MALVKPHDGKLKIGDVVLLHLERCSAFISARRSQYPQIRAHSLLDGVDYPVEVSECRFEITQRFQYTELEKYNSFVAASEKSRAALMTGFDESQNDLTKPAQQDNTTESDECEVLREAADHEMEANKEALTRTAGERVIYGQVVQLRHVTSQKFVSIKKTAAAVEQGTLLLTLETNGNSGSWFNITSGFNTKTEGSPVLYGEMVKFVSPTFKKGWHRSKERITAASMLPVAPHPYIKDEPCFEISASKRASPVKLLPFSVHDPATTNQLLGYSAVTIQDPVAHSKLFDVLGADNVYGCFFDSPTDTSLRATQPKGTYLWRLEPVNLELAGMPLQADAKIRIRHLVTGMYLAGSEPGPDLPRRLSDNGDTDSHGGQVAGQESAVHLTLDFNSPTCLWQMVEYSKDQDDQSFFGSEVFTFLQHRHDSGGWLTCSESEVKLPLLSESVDDAGLAAALAEVPARKAPVISSLRLDRNVLVMRTVDPAFERKVHQVCSAANVVNNFVEKLKELQLPDPEDILTNPTSARTTTHTTAAASQEGLSPEPGSSSSHNTGGGQGTQHHHHHHHHHQRQQQQQQQQGDWLNHLAKVFLASFPQVRQVLMQCRDLLDFKLSLDTSEPDAPSNFQTIMLDIGFIANIVTLMRVCPVKLVTKHVVFSDKAAADAGPSGASPSSSPTKGGEQESHLVNGVSEHQEFDADRAGPKFQLLLNAVKECCTLCHKILQMVCKRNPHIKEVIAKRYLRYIHTHLRLPVNAADTLAAVYEDNIKLIQEATDETLEDFVNLITEFGHRPRVMNFLYRMCGTPDRPVPKNQNRLLDILNKTAKLMLFPGQVFNSNKETDPAETEGLIMSNSWVITVPHPIHEFALLDCSMFRLCPDDRCKASIWEWNRDLDLLDQEPRLRLFVYYIFSLHFICALCYGSNSMSIEAIKKLSKEHKLGLEVDSLLAGIKNEFLPYVLRSVLLGVMVVLYVDVHPYELLKLPRLTRILYPSDRQDLHRSTTSLRSLEELGLDMARHRDVAGIVKTVVAVLLEVSELSVQGQMRAGQRTMPRVSMLNQPNQVMSPLQHTLDTQLMTWTEPLAAEVTIDSNKNKDTNNMSRTSVGRNSYIGSLLQEISRMFKLGLIPLHSEEATEVFKQVFRLLQKFDCFKLTNENRFKKSHSTSVVMEVKVTMLEILRFALEMHNEDQCEKIFAEFAQLRSVESHLVITSKGSKQKDTSPASPGSHQHASPSVQTKMSNSVSTKIAPYIPSEIASKHKISSISSHNVRYLFKSFAQPKAWEEAVVRVVNIFVPAKDSEHNLRELPFFDCNPPGDGWSQATLVDSVLSRLLELVRYDNPLLLVKVFQLVDRVLSRRKKLLRSLMKTEIIKDDDLIALYHRSQVLLSQLRHDYHFIAATDSKVRSRYCKSAAVCFQELTRFLVPGSMIQIEDTNNFYSSELSSSTTKFEVSRSIAVGLQFILRDLRAQDVAVKFLKTPLRRKSVLEDESLVPRLPEAQDEDHRDLVAHCLHFLRHFMVVGDLGPSGNVSTENQDLLLPHVEDICSHLGFSKLVVSGAITALFVKNKKAASQHGALVLRRFIQLLVKYGNKQRGDWVRLMCTFMADESRGPVPENQSLILQWLADKESELSALELFKSKYGQARLMELMASDEHLTEGIAFQRGLSIVEDFDEITEEQNRSLHVNDLSMLEMRHTNQHGSFLGYHVACMKLLVAACMGQEPTFVVQASSYMSLKQVMDVLLYTANNVKPSTLRFVQAEYWNLLRLGYFEPDIQNTRTQVLKESNRIWPNLHAHITNISQALEGLTKPHSNVDLNASLPQKDGPKKRNLFQLMSTASSQAGRYNCLIEVVIAEINLALAERVSELNNQTSARFTLQAYVFPALAKYFEKHFQAHVIYLHEMPNKQICELFSKVQAYGFELENGRPSQVPKLVQQSAIGAAHALAAAMKRNAWAILSHLDSRLTGGIKLEKKSKAERTSLQSELVEDVKQVKVSWTKFVSAIAVTLNVTIEKKNDKFDLSIMPVEWKKHDGVGNLRHAEVFMMARLLTPRYGTKVKYDGEEVVPALPFEAVIYTLCMLLANCTSPMYNNAMTNTFIVRMIDAVRASFQIDDGYGSDAAWQGGWQRLKWIDPGKKKSQRHTLDTTVSPELQQWRRDKYCNLNATYMAARLMAHPNDQVSFAAFELMTDLLEGRCPSVQDHLHQLLSSGEAWTHQLLLNISRIFKKCAWFVYELKHEEERSGHVGGGTGKPEGEKEEEEVDDDSDSDSEKKDGENEEEEEENEGEEDDDEEDVGIKEEVTAVNLNAGGDIVATTLMVVRCLQLMVEGHHEGLQLWLQHQRYSPQPIDMLVEAVDLLAELQNHVLESFNRRDARIPELMVAIMDFLSETVLGPCTNNEKVLSIPQTGLLALSNRMFTHIKYPSSSTNLKARGMGPQCPHTCALMCQVKTSMLALLINILEQSQPETVTRFLEMLNFRVIEKQINRLCKFLGFIPGQRPLPALASISAKLSNELLSFCIFILKLNVDAPSNEDVSDSLPWLPALYYSGTESNPAEVVVHSQSKVMAKLKEFIQTRIGHVEILVHGKLEAVFFPMTARTSKLMQISKWRQLTLESLQKGVSPECRSLPGVKAGEFVAAALDVVQYIHLGNSVEQEDRKDSILNWIMRFAQYRRSMLMTSFYLSVGVFVAILVLESDEHFSEKGTPRGRDGGGEVPAWVEAVEALITTINFTQCALTTLVVLAYLTTDVRMKVRTYQDKRSNQSSDENQTLFKKLQTHLQQLLAPFRGIVEIASNRWASSQAQQRKRKASILRKSRESEVDMLDLHQNSRKDGSQVVFPEISRMSFSNLARKTKKKKKKKEKVLSEDSSVASVEIYAPPPEKTKLKKHRYIDFDALQYLHVIFWDAYFWYLAMIEVASLLALTNDHWLTCLLVIYFVNSESGSTILVAMGRVSGNIVNTFILGILTIFIFGMMTYSLFRDSPDENLPPCKTLYQCIGASMVAGIGQGDIKFLFHEETWTDVPKKFNEDFMKQMRTIMTLVFYMIWQYVLLNIFVGLIASAFEAMRDDVSKVFEDSTSKCLVCSRDMYDFERFTKLGFKHHVEFEHNPLNYVYFLHYLKLKEEKNFTGPDTWVSTKLKSGTNHEERASWLPVSRALSLRRHEEEEYEEVVMQQQQMTNQVSALFAQHKQDTDEQLDEMNTRIDSMNVTVESINMKMEKLVALLQDQNLGLDAMSRPGSSEMAPPGGRNLYR